MREVFNIWINVYVFPTTAIKQIFSLLASNNPKIGSGQQNKLLNNIYKNN